MMASAVSVFQYDKQQALVANWVQELPVVSSLYGSPGCEAISFPQDSVTGFTFLKLGDALSHPWLGINGVTALSETTLAQDFTGAPADDPQFRIQLELHKVNGRLVSVSYRYYAITGFILKSETLKKKFSCRVLSLM
ncbi:hypothetical protein D3C72_1996050 [compost metagenome]